MLDFALVSQGCDAMVAVARPLVGDDAATELASNLASALAAAPDAPDAPAEVAAGAIRHRVSSGWLTLEDEAAGELAAALAVAWVAATRGDAEE